MTDNPEPLDPAEAMQMYLDERRHELADATIQSHRYRLKQFVQWCEQDDIDNLKEFGGQGIHRFRIKRRNEDGLATASMKGQLATLRMFLRFCSTIDAVEPGLDEKIILPTTTEDDARSELLNPDRAQQVLQFLAQYRYALRTRANGGPLAHGTPYRRSDWAR